ncbi:MAG: hypothetical protein Rubg2KO_11080 [Rubricoccaceae bacterium]
MIRSLLLLAAVALATPTSSQTFVINQGNFSDGNGSVTVVSEAVDGSATQLFEGQLGSILQSATQIGDKLYLTANSANRIEIVNVETLARVGQIGGGVETPFSSPRYIEPVDGTDRVYVSNQVYFGDVSSFVLPVMLSENGGTAGTPIEVDGLPEGMTLLGDSLYVALGTFGPGSGVDSLAVIDVRQNVLAGYLDLECYSRTVLPRGLIGLEEGLAVFCEDTDEMLFIDTDSRTVSQRFAFGEDIGDPSGVGQGVGPALVELVTRRPAPDATNYYVITGTSVTEVSRRGIEQSISIPDADTKPISAVSAGQDLENPVLILGRPDPVNPFTADGTITVHDLSGTLLATYPAGIYPTQVTFDAFVFPPSTQGEATAALRFELAGPNPARGASALAFTLRQPEDARVTIHDLLGRTVATVTDRAFSAGDQRVELDVSGLAPGPYRVRLTVGDRVASLPLTVVR